MKKLLLLTFSLTLLFSCNKDKEKELQIPDDQIFDINGDLKADFEVRYSSVETTDIPPSSHSAWGSIKPLNNNQLLKNQNSALFLRKGDTIKTDNNTDSEWINYSKNVIQISGNNNIWDKNWTISSELNQDYYLGVKIEERGTYKIGWVKLLFNTSSGAISYEKIQLSDNAFLIIE